MLELFSSETTVVVGLELSGREENLIRTAVSLAQKTGTRLVFVHALSSGPGVAFHDEAAYFDESNFLKSRDILDERDALQNLYALRDRLPPELFVDIRVLKEYPEDALELVAEETDANLIMVGMRKHNNDRWLGEISTGVVLMGSSHFPVMVQPLDVQMDFMSSHHKLLVADNFRTEGLSALQAALGLCRSIAYEDLVHVHVEQLSYEDLHLMAEKMKISMIEGLIPDDPDFDEKRFIERVKDESRLIMSDRLKEADIEFCKGVHWIPRVRFGNPVVELSRTAQQTHADLMIFGKHHLLNPAKIKEGSVIGSISYADMINYHIPSIVVPDRREGHMPYSY